MEIDAVAVCEWRVVFPADVCVEVGFVGEDLALVVVDCEGCGLAYFGGDGTVDAPGLEEAGRVGG